MKKFIFNIFIFILIFNKSFLKAEIQEENIDNFKISNNLSLINNNIEKLTPFLKDIKLDIFLEIIRFPELSSIISETNKDQLTFIGLSELFSFIFYVIFKTWIKSKIEKEQWIKLIWTDIWTTAFLIMATTLIIPRIQFGEKYFILIKKIFYLFYY